MPSKLEELPPFIMFTLPTSVCDKAGQTGRARVNMLYSMWHQGPSDTRQPDLLLMKLYAEIT